MSVVINEKSDNVMIGVDPASDSVLVETSGYYPISNKLVTVTSTSTHIRKKRPRVKAKSKRERIKLAWKMLTKGWIYVREDSK